MRMVNMSTDDYKEAEPVVEDAPVEEAAEMPVVEAEVTEVPAEETVAEVSTEVPAEAVEEKAEEVA